MTHLNFFVTFHLPIGIKAEKTLYIHGFTRAIAYMSAFDVVLITRHYISQFPLVR